jgi:hypothetical protein
MELMPSTKLADIARSINHPTEIQFHTPETQRRALLVNGYFKKERRNNNHKKLTQFCD